LRLRRFVAIAGSVAALGIAAPACRGSSSSSAAAVRLDGSPRVPDDEGVATSLSRTRITLDGKRTYAVSTRLVSFATATGAIEPMLSREGQYVQIGVVKENGHRLMVWMAGFAAVVPSTPPAVYYQGRFVRRDGALAIFRDGTVLRLGAGVKVPKANSDATVQIDPATHLVVDMTP